MAGATGSRNRAERVGQLGLAAASPSRGLSSVTCDPFTQQLLEPLKEIPQVGERQHRLGYSLRLLRSW